MSSIHTPAHKRLVKLLRQARLDRGLTQTEVAKKLRKPQSFVSSCEAGQRRIDVIELLEFAKLYDVPIQQFLTALRIRE